MEYTATQMMAISLARQIKDNKTYIVGTGLPLVGTTLAKNTHAPGCRLLFESAQFMGNPQEVPTSVADLRIGYQASALLPTFQYLGFQVNYHKDIELGFLGGAQIDIYGNLNSTCIGDYYHPETRFSGSGGANGIATYCSTVIIMKHEKRRFIEKVDYVTCCGWGDGPNGREKLGLDPSVGPQAVVTELGIMRFDEKTKRMYLAEYFPGGSPEKVQENTGFELDLSRAVESVPPDEKTLDVLIKKVDPMRMMV